MATPVPGLLYQRKPSDSAFRAYGREALLPPTGGRVPSAALKPSATLTPSGA